MDPNITSAHGDLQVARQTEHDAQAALDKAVKERETAEQKLDTLLTNARTGNGGGNPSRKGHGR